MQHVERSHFVPSHAPATLSRVALGCLLAFGAINAAGGAWYGLAGARGAPLEWLAGSPFEDYFVPSFLLLAVVGGSLLTAAIAVFKGSSIARRAARIAGTILAAWIVAQMAIIGFVSWLQPITALGALAVLALAQTLPPTPVSVQMTPSVLFSFFAGTIRKPTRTFEALVRERRRLAYGTYALLTNAALYTLVYVFLVMGHGRPTVFAPWLAIDPELYYRWEVFLVAPSMILSWLVAGAVTQLAARAFGGAGSFEDTLSALGFATAVASWTTLGHDLLTSALGAFGVIDQRAYEDALSSATPFRALIWILMLAYLVAFVFLYAKAVAVVHRQNAGRALLAGALGFCAYQGVFVLFNR